jgi:hypothetical protein
MESTFINRTNYINIINTKILGDMQIHKYQIFCYLIILLVSFLLKFRPIYLSMNYVLPIILIIPLFVLLIGLEFRDSYLIGSNNLAKSWISFLCYYSYILMNSFIFLLILRENEVSWLNNFSIIIYFIPVYSILFVCNIFWIFLYYGFSKLENKSGYFLVLGNLIFISTVSISVYFKLSFSNNFIHWTSISIWLIFIQLVNFVSYLYNSVFITQQSKTSKMDFNSKPLDSLVILLNVCLNLAYFLFIYTYGMYLEGLISTGQHTVVFLGFWIFCILSLFKSFYKIGKITLYYEWKKNVLL